MSGAIHREQGNQKAITMWDTRRKPCLRCGVKIEPSHNPTAKVVGFCRDCRAADPQGVANLAGVPVEMILTTPVPVAS